MLKGFLEEEEIPKSQYVNSLDAPSRREGTSSQGSLLIKKTLISLILS